MTGLLSNLLILVALAAVVGLGLRIAQSIFGTGSKRAAATETAARLVSYPTGSAAVLRRRFVRSLTGQHVVMPSGERHAFGELVVRIAPEDLERLDPDGDLDRLGDDGARLYVTHARRQGWSVPDHVGVTVEVDAALRSGWVPPARGRGRGPIPPPADRSPGWDVIAPAPRAAAGLRAVPPPATTVLARTESAETGTVEVPGELHLALGDVTAVVSDPGRTVLGRLPASPVRLDDPEVSYRHAAVRRAGGRWQVQDLGSTNGTAVDGERVDPQVWTPLRSGSVVTLAGVRIGISTGRAGTVHRGDLTSRP